VNFTNTVIIMTSNAGSTLIQNWDKDEQKLQEELMEILKSLFRPEFLNRIDEIISFVPLSQEHLNKIVEIQMKEVEKRLLDRKISLRLTPDAIHLLGKRGYDPQFGARPLKRVIQREILDPLAMQILSGSLHEEKSVEIRVKDDHFDFKVL